MLRQVLNRHVFQSLTLPPGERKRDILTFVGDAIAYVAAEALVGTYTDDRGRSYVFGNDGWVVFPDRKFRYAVGVYHVLNDNELLRVLTLHQLPRPLPGADHGFDQRDSQAAFLEFEQAVDGAARRRGDNVL